MADVLKQRKDGRDDLGTGLRVILDAIERLGCYMAIGKVQKKAWEPPRYYLFEKQPMQDAALSS